MKTEYLHPAPTFNSYSISDSTVGEYDDGNDKRLGRFSVHLRQFFDDYWYDSGCYKDDLRYP